MGATLLSTAYSELTARYGAMPSAGSDRPRYLLFLPPDWRDRPEVHGPVQDRVTCAERAGLVPVVERSGLRWTPDAGLPGRSARLRFGPAADDPALLDVIRRIDIGTLDVGCQHDVAELGAEAAARKRVRDLVDSYQSPQDWWRLGYDRAGEVVGFVAPTSHQVGSNGEIGFVGVVAGRRGHHYSDDLLAEGTHLLAGTGAQEIRLHSDVANVPIVAA